MSAGGIAVFPWQLVVMEFEIAVLPWQLFMVEFGIVRNLRMSHRAGGLFVMLLVVDTGLRRFGGVIV